MSDRSEWSDARIGDEFDRARHRLQVLEERIDSVPVRLTSLEAAMEHVAVHVRECNEGVRALDAAIEGRREEDRKERKSDRRWLIGIALTVLTILISAFTIIQSSL